MTKQKGKKFTLKDLDLKVDHINKQSSYILNEETGDYISYYPRFSKSKKDKLFEELLHTHNYVKENKLDYFNNDFELIHYLHFLIFKYFTSLHNELKDKSVETHFETFHKLYESGLLEEFLHNVFDQEEIAKVLDQFYDIIEKIPMLAKLENEFKQEVASKVQSDVIKKKIIPEV